MALNATRPVALVLGLSVATLLSFTGFVVKRFITERPLVIAPLVEAGPALALLHSYFYWRSGHAALPPLAILSTVGLFWTYYEIWNFARRLSAAALPYELTQDRLRVLLVTLLALAVGFTVSVARAAHLSTWFVVYSALLAAGFAVWMLLPSAVAAPEARPPAYDAAPRLAAGTPLEWRPVRDRDALPSTGLILVAALQVAVAVELIWPFVVS